MADTTIVAGNVVEQWDENFFEEYNRADKLMPYHGTSENSIIQVKENLTKKAGDKLTVSLVTRLNGAGVVGSATLEGNEEALDNYADQVEINQIRNAVRIAKMEEIKTVIDMRDAAKVQLKNWMANHKLNVEIQSFMSPNLDGVTAYGATAEADRDAWTLANSDRVLFGSVLGNLTGDHSVDLLKVDSVNDMLSPGTLSLAKRMAKQASPAIRPVKLANGEEWFVAFAPSYAFRDLKNHNTITAAQREAMLRGEGNPLFSGGDILWDGIIVKEVEEIPSIVGEGNGGIDVSTVLFCGAQALTVAWGQRTKSTTKTFDYEDKYGIAIGEIRGIKKLFFNDKQHGMLTLYVANVADA